MASSCVQVLQHPYYDCTTNALPWVGGIPVFSARRWSNTLVLEYEDVLMRQVGGADRDPVVVTKLLDYLCAAGKRQRIFYLWRPFLPDPQDDMVLELAVAAGCNAIVTHNRRHLARAVEFGIRVLRPAEFLEEIGVVP